mgnify:CR=1 FL=1
MDNKDMPAMPTGLIDEDVLNEDGEYRGQVEAKYTGLTKREHFCLKMGVPKTGDPELDEIINEGNKIKLAGLAMQGLLSNSGAVIQSNSQSGFGWCNGAQLMPLLALDCADSLLAQLDKGDK